MKKKLFLSLLLSTSIGSLIQAQTTYYLQAPGPLPVDMSNPSNWVDTVAVPSDTATVFTNPGDTWDMNGVNGNLSNSLILAGDLKNSGTLASIDLQNRDLTLQGVVQGANITIHDGFPGTSTSIVEYASSLTSKDLIAGTYTNLHISGEHAFTATGDITIDGVLSSSGGFETRISMGAHNLIAGSAFTVGPVSSTFFNIETYSTSASPLPKDVIWPDNTRIIYNSPGQQHIVSGSYYALFLPDSSASKTIDAGDTVEVRHEFDNRSELILEANDSSYAQLKSNTAMVNGGTISKQYYLETDSARYFHMGTALVSANLKDLNEGQTMVFANSGQGSVWKWNASSSEWEPSLDQNNQATVGNTVYAGTNAYGYFLFSGNSAVVDLSGTNLHFSNAATFLDYDNSGDPADFVDNVIDGWNFIANPFLANYDFEGHDTSSTNTGSIANYYYVFNGTNYIFYQQGGLTTGAPGTTASSGAPQHIAPGQGFWVRTSSDWDGSTIFDTANLSMSNPSQMYQTTLPADIIKLNVAEVGGNYSDQVIIRLDQNATDAEDFSLDVPKKSNPGNVPNTFVKLGNGTYALCAANPSRKSFPLHFRDTDHGQQMEYSIWQNSLATYGKVFIEDKKNKSFTEITNANYTFTNDTAFGEDRFVIHFESGVGLPEGMIPGATAFDAFYGHGSIHFTFQEENFRPTSGSLYTLQGKMVCTFEINDPNTSISIPNVATGIYLLAIDGDTAGARKLYINK